MARLILLNGMPGIGKSTLAERYADDHAGVLNLDVDRLRRTMGGDFSSTAEPARALALTMATARLREGDDVVIPQLIARADQIDRFAGAAPARRGTPNHRSPGWGEAARGIRAWAAGGPRPPAGHPRPAQPRGRGGPDLQRTGRPPGPPPRESGILIGRWMGRVGP